ncbi:MAG: hypothetical protein ACT4PU_11405 [Planctomycetota bacterium]
MDLQIARVRVVAPQSLDFAALVDGVIRNNVGVAEIRFEAEAVFETVPDGDTSSPITVRLQRTGQRFHLADEPADFAAELAAGVRWRAFRVLYPEDSARTVLVTLSPSARSATGSR